MQRDILTLSQWLSPAFPVGAFACSHGLETAIHDGWVEGADGLRVWLGDLLEHGSGRSDAVLMAAAHAASTHDSLAEVDGIGRAFQPSFERLRESDRMGAAFARTVRDVWALDVPDCLYPVAVGRAARMKEMAWSDAAGLYLHAFAANLVSAAVRLVPLGQTEGQAVLAALAPLCARLSSETAGATLDDLAGCAFLSDIASMRHETQEPRVFQT